MNKKYILTTALVLLLQFWSFSQNLLEENRIIYSELDTNNIKSGILIDKAVNLSGIEKFDGKTTKFVCNQTLWQEMFFELNYAKNNFLCSKISSDSAYSVLNSEINLIFGRKKQFSNGKLIPIYLLNFDYNKIKENAFDDGLLFLKDDKILENPKKDKSPYTTNKAFAATPYKEHTYYGSKFSFIFNGNFLFTNTNEKITEIIADFDNGMGEQFVNLNQEIPVSYTNLGLKYITIKAITDKNDTLSSKFEFEIKGFDIPDYDLIRFKTDETTGTTRWFCPLNHTYYNTLVGALHNSPCVTTLLKENICHSGGDLYHFKATETPDIPERILLVVEGFDVGDNMFAEELYGDVFNRQKFADCILDNNFDIYILNFDLPTDDIQKNAELVENVIDYLNEIKPNKTELVIAGGSMGGLVTRYALTTMEHKGKDPQTRLWFSFDSPQEGANIPLGIQYWLDELNNCFPLPPLKKKIDRLCDPAAKQMLIYHFLDYPNQAPEKTQFVSDLNALGYPQTCRNVAITNGASDGTSQGYNNGDMLLDITWKMLTAKRRYMYAWAMPNGGNNFTVFKKVKVRSNGTIILMDEKFVNGIYPIDAAPGGFRGTMLELKNSLDTIFGIAAFKINAFHHNHAFIPAISALGLDVTQLDGGYYYNFYEEEPDVLLSKSPFDNLFFPKVDKSINQEHVWVSFETANNIFDEIIPFDIVMGDDPDWQTGEIMAENSIHLTSGFHGSADEQIHLHLDQIDRTILEEENYVPDTKNIKQSISPKNSAQIIETTDKIKIYPNPANDNIRLLVPLIDNYYQVIIQSIYGNILIDKQNITNGQEININNLIHGTYLLTIKSQNYVWHKKFIKN